MILLTFILQSLSRCVQMVSFTALRFLSTLSRYQMLRVSRRGCDSKVGLVELNRPDIFNALCPQLVEELASAVAQMDSDPSIHCIVLTGSERVFSGELKQSNQGGDRPIVSFSV